MRVPLSWLLEYAALEPADSEPGISLSAAGLSDAVAAEVARRLTAAGLEVESVEQVGHDITGVVVGQVREIEELSGFRKPIRYCRMSIGGGTEHHVICGATNFAVGDLVPLALPGSTLPGGVEIGARPAYGRTSEGMICSAAELAVGDDHDGILVLPADAPLGEDFASYAGLRDHVLDIAVTPDKGYALSIRGVARELAIAFGAEFTDPADALVPGDVAEMSADIYPASIEDASACDRFVLREVRGIDETRPVPLWMRVRLARSGMRSVSLAVDVNNYLMLELGQPMHAFDRARLTGPVVVRRARPGERLETLDHVVRDLDPDDILITDSSGPISMAGTMGGLATEISAGSSDLVIEAAHFSPAGTARMSRRHKLNSEASMRFARGVDRELPLRASARAASMLASLGGGIIVPGCTHASEDVPPVAVVMALDYPDQVAGVVYGLAVVARRLRHEFPGQPERWLCAETIYQAVYRPDLGGLVGVGNPDSRSDRPGTIGRCGPSSTSLSAPSFDSSLALASMAATSTRRTSRSSSSAISSGCSAGRRAHAGSGPSTGSCSRPRAGLSRVTAGSPSS